MTNEEKSREIANNNCTHACCSHGEHYFTSSIDCYKAAMEMATWKDEQFIETAQEDAENYVKGVAKSNPDLSVGVLKLLETAYIAGRNRIK